MPYTVLRNGVVIDFEGRKLPQYKTPTGYVQVMLKQDGKRKKALVHRLVALAFIPNPLNKPCVNHIDGNKENNSVENLEWCTYSENELHSHRKLGKKLSPENHKK